MRHDAELHHRRRRGRLLALTEGGGDIIRSIFADGTDGFYFDFSKTDRLFQNLTGTPADDAGENIYLALESHAWGGRSYAEQLAFVTPALFDDFSTYADTAAMLAAGWTAGSNTLATLSSAAIRVENTAASVGNAYRSFATVAGRTYKASARLVSKSSVNAARVGIGTAAAGTTLGLMQFSAASTLVLYFTATATTTYVSLITNALLLGDQVTFDDISIVPVPGNHGLQATTSAQPKWQTGGLARFDGSDDNLLTTLVPGTAMTFMSKVKLTEPLAAGVVMTGSRVTGTNSRFYFGFDVDEQLFANVGNNVVTRIGSLYNTVGVAGLVLSGGNATLYWNGVAETPGAVGTPNTTIALPLGAINTSGVISGFFPGDLYDFLAIKKALTAAEIAAITNLWGTS